MTKESIPGVRPVRVGGIDYLNALPLTRYLAAAGEPPLEISNHVPSVLAQRLAAGDLDVALVPVVEYLAHPDYRVVPGISIASYGEVRSIRFFHRRELNEMRTVGLDESSRTSAALTRLLCKALWGGKPEFCQLDPRHGLAVLEDAERSLADDSLDGTLLIGDAALRARASAGWECLDLGTVWTRWTGLPLVYAFWVWRGGQAPAGLTHRLVAARNEGLARIDDIVRERAERLGEDPVAGRYYLHRIIQYDFNTSHIEGFLELSRRLQAHRILPHIARERAADRCILQWLEESPSLPA